ncbi:sensor domain-containing diguanylate cyclase [Novosphingobium sp. Fuku2-ISO-50]|uniref:GGDEF domain-containing protein n=1 Tax=Novosphingobium sp. Fuku2-ISO-50 TaxID=1739114 RepID=UPI000A96BC97|nr:sensor domain-containing diguanylate cyclase [Novosphingobium sp. Fuku2-ISO-50]
MDMLVAMMSSRLGRLIPRGLFLLAYFLSMVLGLVLSRFDRGVAVVWFAGAVLFVQFVLSPRRRWLGLILGAVPCGALAIACFGLGAAVALPLAVIGVIEAWGAAFVVKRVYPRFGRLQSIDEVVRFLGVAGLLLPAASGVPAAWFVHFATGLPYDQAWRDWFAAHALGFIAFSPPLLLARQGEAIKWMRSASPDQKREAAILLGIVALVTTITFGQKVFPLVLLPVIAMVAATLRLGRFGAMASVMILIAIGLVGTSAGYGPTTFVHVGTWLRFEVLQGYFASVVVLLLPLSAELAARRRLLERVQAAEALHRLIIERSSDVIMRVKVDGKVIFASPSVARLWGYLPEDVVGRSVFEIIHPRDAPRVRASRHAVMESKDAVAVIEYRTLCRDGRELWVEGSTRAVLDHLGRVSGTLTIIRDISERHAMVDTLARQAMTDPLTGLANRRAFDQDLARGLATGQSGCLALFDLDHFKRINDLYGHTTGDRVIQVFAEVLRQSVRGGDNAVRLGGEEFAVLLFGARIADARQICERILQRFAARENHPSVDTVLRATVSAGLAPFEPGTSPEAVMTAADTALYHAKNSGRNRLAVAA